MFSGNGSRNFKEKAKKICRQDHSFQKTGLLFSRISESMRKPRGRIEARKLFRAVAPYRAQRTAKTAARETYSFFPIAPPRKDRQKKLISERQIRLWSAREKYNADAPRHRRRHFRNSLSRARYTRKKRGVRGRGETRNVLFCYASPKGRKKSAQALIARDML